MRANARWTGALLVVLLGGCGEAPEQPPDGGGVAVRLARVERATLEETARGVGTLRSADTVELQAETAGRVEEVHFEEGASVEQGQRLFTIRGEALQARLAAREAALQSARVRAAEAESAVQRRRPLRDTGAVSQEEISSAEAELRQARAEIQRLQAEIRELEEELDDTRVDAPFSGRISERFVDPGAYVQVGEALATLYRDELLEVEFQLPERVAGRAQLGQRVHVVPSGAPEHAFDARVAFVSPAVEVAGRDLRLKARPEQPPPAALTPGMSITAELVLETRVGQPVVPADALVGTREGYVVFVVEEGRAHRRPVRIGLREPGRVEILEGVAVGAHVVREGHMRLTDGAPVRPVGDRSERGARP